MPQAHIQNDFTAGMMPDLAPHEIPENGAALLNDLLTDQRGKLYQRGAFTNFSSITALGGGANTPVGVYQAYYPAVSPSEVTLATANDGKIYQIKAASATASLGTPFSAGANTRGSWAFYLDKTILCPGVYGNVAAVVPRKITWNGTTATYATLGGSPPAMNVIGVYKSRLVGANGNGGTHPNRLYFSPVPDIEGTWDTTNSWIDGEHAIKGIAALRNMLILFGDNGLERIIGDTPPPYTNMDRATFSSIGLQGMPGESAVTVWNDNAIFANTTGVWMTNGGTPVDLTAYGGMKNFWRSLNFAGYPDWVALGVYRNTLMVSHSSVNPTIPGILCFDFLRKAWYSIGGFRSDQIYPYQTIAATQFANGQLGGTEELLFVDGTRWGYSPVQTSSVFIPGQSFTTYHDPSNTSNVKVAPRLTTRTFTGNGLVNRKRWTFGRVTYDLVDAASNNPTLTVTPYFGLESGHSKTATVLPETTQTARGRVQLFAEAQGCQLSINATTGNVQSDLRIYGVEVNAADLPFDLDGTGDVD